MGPAPLWIVRLALVTCLAGPPDALAQEATARFGPLDSSDRLIVRGTTDIEVFGPVLEAFAEIQSNLGILYEQWLSNDLLELSEAACRGDGDPADLIVSSAIDHQVKLVNDGCARAYRSAWTERLPGALNWRDELFGVTREPAVMVYNRERVPPAEAPRSRFDLIDLLRPPDSPYAGRVATYDIESSGLGYLFAFADSQEATTFGRLLEALGRSSVRTSCCSSDLIDAVAEGRALIAYNVLGSYALARAALDSRIAVVVPSDYVLILSRAAMIPRSARNPLGAQALLDFLLSDEGRRVLRRASLVVSFGDVEAGVLEVPEGIASAIRPIPLSPVLLVGLDRHKRQLFIERWRAVLAPAP
jgi:iron(III) transport system substrate-binding protein